MTIIRAVLVDLEPGTMDSVRSGPYGQVPILQMIIMLAMILMITMVTMIMATIINHDNEIIIRSSVRTTLSSVRAELATTGPKATTPRVRFFATFFGTLLLTPFLGYFICDTGNNWAKGQYTRRVRCQ